MIRPGERVLLAVSGGPDSVALSHSLVELAREHRFDLHLAHLNHGLREGADCDEAFCAELADRLELPFACSRVDVAREARRNRLSIEEQARNSRYRFLEESAEQWGCRRIAAAHTQNDQAETFLLRLLRGSGATGLAAMRPIVPLGNASLIRPLLEVTRPEVLAFLESRTLAYRLDPTNQDRTIPRNRIRHETLPLLARLNPNLIATLARTTHLLREDEEWMEEETARVLEGMTSFDQGRLWLPVNGLDSLHLALRRRVIRGAIAWARGDLRAVTSRHVQDVLGLTAAGRSGRRLCLPGLQCGRSFDRIWFQENPLSHRPPSASRLSGHAPQPTAKDERRSYNGFEYAVTVPGELVIPEAGGSIRVEEAEPSSLPGAAGHTVKVALGEGDISLRVRSPMPGDRFRPLGAPGSKSVSRYLMERRVDRDRRRVVPLVVRSDEEILWVAGHGISEASRVTADAQRVLRLSWLVA